MVADAPEMPVLIAAAITLSPWVAYSLTTFGTLFATDNSHIALSLDARAFMNDWWPEPQHSFGDDPASWVGKVACNAPKIVWIAASIAASPLGFACVSALAVWGVFHYVATRRPAVGVPTSQRGGGLGVVIGFTALLALLLAPQIVTGYVEYRYYSALAWAGFLTAGFWAISRAISAAQRRAYAGLITAA